MTRFQVYRHVLKLSISSRPWSSVLVFTMIMFTAGATAVTGLSQRWLVDEAESHAIVGVVLAAMLGGVAYAIQSTVNRMEDALELDLSVKADSVIEGEILRRASTVPLSSVSDAGFLDSLFTLRRGTLPLARYAWKVVATFATIASLGASLWLLASVSSWFLLLVVFAAPPILFALRSNALVNRAINSVAEIRRHELHLHRLSTQSASAKELLVSGAGPLMAQRATDAWDEATRVESRARVTGVFITGVGWLLFAGGLALSLFWVVQLIQMKSASLGDLVLVIALGTRLQGQISSTVASLNELNEGRLLADHYAKLMTRFETSTPGKRAVPTRLFRGVEVDGVSFTYPGQEKASLHNVTFKIPAGTSIAIVGENGAGKTTLVQLLAGLLTPQSGSIRVDGVDIRHIGESDWAKLVAPTFQDFTKPLFRAHEAVGLGDTRHIDDLVAVEHALVESGARPILETLRMGLQTQLGLPFGGQELSGGQWQRLALARGAMRQHPLLSVLDEPTAALDPQSEHELFEAFLLRSSQGARNRGMVSVLVSHRFSTVHNADAIVVLDDGHVVEYGSHAALISIKGTYSRLFNLQRNAYSDRKNS